MKLTPNNPEAWLNDLGDSNPDALRALIIYIAQSFVAFLDVFEAALNPSSLPPDEPDNWREVLSSELIHDPELIEPDDE